MQNKSKISLNNSLELAQRWETFINEVKLSPCLSRRNSKKSWAVLLEPELVNTHLDAAPPQRPNQNTNASFYHHHPYKQQSGGALFQLCTIHLQQYSWSASSSDAIIPLITITNLIFMQDHVCADFSYYFLHILSNHLQIWTLIQSPMRQKLLKINILFNITYTKVQTAMKKRFIQQWNQQLHMVRVIFNGKHVFSIEYLFIFSVGRITQLFFLKVISFCCSTSLTYVLWLFGFLRLMASIWIFIMGYCNNHFWSLQFGKWPCWPR